MEPNPEVDAYVAAADEKRRPTLEAIRALCHEELEGFGERIEYGMPAYYRLDDEQDGMAFANQKQYISLYVTRTDVMEKHRHQLEGLDLGKGCIRYRSMQSVDLDVIRDILRTTASTRGTSC